jgi:diguanylate cyclase (GGDEF)-like protein/PAS domain S-box-containing protein
MAIVGSDRRWLEVNDHFCKMVGYSRDELTRMSWADLTYPDELGASELGYQRLLKGEIDEWKIEKRYLRKDGRILHVNISTSALRRADGRVSYFVSVIEDATERKRAEQLQQALYRISEAAASVHDLDALYRAIHAAIGELIPARNFYITLYNPATNISSFPYFMDEYDSAPAPRPLGHGLTDYVIRHGEPLFASPEVFLRLCAQGEVESIGTPSVDWLGVPLKNADLQTIGAMVVQTYTEGVRYTQDDLNILSFVSQQTGMAIERVRSRAALHMSEERFRIFFNHSPDPVLLVDMGNFTIIDCNQATCQVTGYTHDELVGEPVFKLNPDDFLPNQDLPFLGDLALGKNVKIETTYIRKDGVRPPIEAHLGLIEIDGRKVLLVTDRELTERKNAEAEMRLAHARLKRRNELLGQILEVGNTLRLDLGIEVVLEQLVQAAHRSLGFRVVVISVLDEKSNGFTVKHYAGLPVASERLVAGAQFTVPELQQVIRPRFRVGRCYFIPAGALDWRQFSNPLGQTLLMRGNGFHKDDPQRWQGQDALLVPIENRDRIVAVLWVDAPVDKLRPTSEVFQALEIFSNQAATAFENARLYGEIKRLAIIDDLTGLYNRRGLFSLGGREMERCRRFERPFSAVFLDIDNFKLFNDTYSYAVGDQVLRLLSLLLKEKTREIDLVGRYGGEEFVILLAECDCEAATETANRLREEIAQMGIQTEWGELAVTASAGVSQWAESCASLEELIEQAGQALHIAKQTGRNRIAIG